MPYRLAYPDRFIRASSPITGDVCEGSIPFPFYEQDTENRIVYHWTGAQITRLFSALKTGADLIFPEVANDILWDFLKGLSCPPELEEENQCFEYSNSAPFIHYFPDNPDIAGDKAFGWNKEAWYRWGDFDTLFPDWLDNWLIEFAGALLGYEDTDILFNIESLAAPSILAFLGDGGVLPRIEIQVTGTGVIEVELLSFPLGGKAIIELDEEPNILDILTGGILDEGAFMVELNRDVINFPPDEYPVVNVEINVETPGTHTLYISFLPVIDDASVPLLFGGGIRSVELCGFEDEGTVSGVDSIIWDGCALKSVTGGVETVIVTAEEIQACMDIPEGGGGGLASIVADTGNLTLGANVTTTNTTYTRENVNGVFSHAFTKANAIVQLTLYMLNSGANGTYVRPILRDNLNNISKNGDNLTEARNNGTTGRTITVTDVFTGITNAYTQCAIEWKVSAGTGTIQAAYDIQWVVIEFDDVSDLFVEDVRYLDGVLEKKIGGVWIDVVDIDALLDPIAAAAAAASAAAAAAQTTANGAVTVNSAQTTIINNHTTRLNNLESDVDDLILSVAQHNLDIAGHEARLDALEAASGDSPYFAGGVWSRSYDFGGYSSASVHWELNEGTDSNGFAPGIVSTAANPSRLNIQTPIYTVDEAFQDERNNLTHICIKLRNAQIGTIVVNVSVDLEPVGTYQNTRTGGSDADFRIWIRIPNSTSNNSLIVIEATDGQQFYLTEAILLGRGVEPPLDTAP